MLRSAVGPLGTSQVREAVQVRKSREDFNYDIVYFGCNFSPKKRVRPSSSKQNFDISAQTLGSSISCCGLLQVLKATEALLEQLTPADPQDLEADLLLLGSLSRSQ